MSQQLLDKFPFSHQSREIQIKKLARIFSVRPSKTQAKAAEKAGVSRPTIKRFDEAYEQLSELEKAEFGQMMTGYRIRKILDDNRETSQV